MVIPLEPSHALSLEDIAPAVVVIAVISLALLVFKHFLDR
jgi:hypothetical protein